MKNYPQKILLLVCLAVLLATPAFIYAKKRTVLYPGLGRHFQDPQFGSSTIQVTSSTDGSSCINQYSYWPSFNQNDTQFFITCDEIGYLYNFDPINFRVLGKQKLFAKEQPALTAEDAIWSNRNPNILFARSGLKLWAYNTLTRTYVQIHDFAGELPNLFLFQLSKSTDDNRFAFTLKNPNNDYQTYGYAVWDRRQNRIIYQEATNQLDEVQLDKSGKFLVVKTGLESAGQIRVKVVTLDTGIVKELTAGAPDFAPGHSDNGFGTLLGYDNWNNQYTLRNFSNNAVRTILDLGQDWSQGSHISFLENGDSEVLISLYKANDLKSGPYNNQIILIKTGTGKVKPLANHGSTYRDYYDAPRANISRSGKFVVYTSNQGTNRRDVFVLKVP